MNGTSEWLVLAIALITASAAILAAIIAARTANTRQQEQLDHDTKRQQEQLDHDTKRQEKELAHDRDTRHRDDLIGLIDSATDAINRLLRAHERIEAAWRAGMDPGGERATAILEQRIDVIEAVRYERDRLETRFGGDAAISRAYNAAMEALDAYGDVIEPFLDRKEFDPDDPDLREVGTKAFAARGAFHHEARKDLAAL